MSKQNKQNKQDIDAVSPENVGKQFVATKTTSIIAGSNTFQLVEGQEISKEISETFIASLINSNLIK